MAQFTKVNREISLLASAARTATVSSSDVACENGRGVLIRVNVSASAATPSVVFTVESKVGGAYRTVLTSAAVTGAGTTWLRVYPGVTAVAAEAVSDVIGHTFRVTATHADADSITYSVQAVVLV